MTPAASHESKESKPSVEEVSSVLREWMDAARVPAEIRAYVLEELVVRQSLGSRFSSAS